MYVFDIYIYIYIYERILQEENTQCYPHILKSLTIPKYPIELKQKEDKACLGIVLVNKL